MIKTLEEFSVLAQERGPKKLAVLAPEDEEFMRAVKSSWDLGYIEPVLVGDTRKMEEVAEKVAFNIDRFHKIPQTGQQAISNLGINMLFSGELPIASKGQIPTSYIYRSIIREEAKAGSGMTVSVISFWDIPGMDHLVAFTDTGVNIKPGVKAKAEVIKNAVFVYHLMGYPRPKIAVLSGQREVGGTLDSYKDYEILIRSAAAGDFGECEIVPATSFTDIFLGEKTCMDGGADIQGDEVPHILVVPCLDTGNILCKLDFFLDVTRSSLVATSRGPVCIPARSDFSGNIVQQLAMCVVLADEMEKREQ
ncbi:MAG TPA: phosphate acyltransferase [Desulfomonilia bacterium]|nr:phosphate acyltransferase [Desulfomonilia bacterium]